MFMQCEMLLCVILWPQQLLCAKTVEHGDEDDDPDDDQTSCHDTTEKQDALVIKDPTHGFRGCDLIDDTISYHST